MAETVRLVALADFLVPDLGEGLEEATVVGWLVAAGEQVVLNQPLCTLETAKAEVEVPSPYEGVVVALGGAPGDTLAVGTLLARFEVVAAGPQAATSPTSSRPQPTLVGYGHDESIDRSRRRSRSAGRAPGAHVTVDGAGSPTPVPTRTPPPASRPLASPPVRKLARDLGIDLAALAPGSGPDGIVTRADVHRAADAAANGAAIAPLAPAALDGPVGPVADQIIAVRGIRARVAERMAVSRRTIPDATCGVTVDCTRLLELRAQLNDAAAARGDEPVVTPFALLCRMIVHSLGRTPILNSTFDDESKTITVRGSVHLGVGTATPNGLVVTVVRDAQAMTTGRLSAALARLTMLAREGRLGPAELTGSTFTVSNFGALGLDEGIPVINHPEAAIVGIGSVKPRPHVVDGEVIARSTASITLAFDHRVCDGAEAARFLNDVRRLVEAPALLLLDT